MAKNGELATLHQVEETKPASDVSHNQKTIEKAKPVRVNPSAKNFQTKSTPSTTKNNRKAQQVPTQLEAQKLNHDAN